MREARVLPKLVVLVLVAGATAATLLAIRQRRVESAHELARIQGEIADHDKAIWKLRLEIAGRVKPSEVRHLAGTMGPLAPIYSDECETRAEGAPLPRSVGADAPALPGRARTPRGHEPAPNGAGAGGPTARREREAR